MLAVTNNRSTLQRNTKSDTVPAKLRFLLEPHGVTSQKTPFFKKEIGILFKRPSVASKMDNYVVTARAITVGG
jgi:hypothetical protein